MAIKVKLLQKKISGNRQSLYLDFYPAIPHPKTGKPTRREFLKLDLFDKPKTDADKLHNKDNLQLAQQIQQKCYQAGLASYTSMPTTANAINLFIKYHEHRAAAGVP